MDQRLLREYVRAVLLREIGPDVTYGQSLSKILWEPVADAGKAVGAEIQKLSSQAQETLETLVKGLVGLVIPGLEADYADISRKHQTRLDQIEREYADVFERVGQGVKGAMRVAFMLDPVAVLTGNTMRAAPSAIVNAVSFLAADALSLKQRSLLRRLRSESRLLEQGVTAKQAATIMSSQDVRRAIAANPIVKKMRADAVSLIQAELKDIEDLYRRIAEVDSIDELDVGGTFNMRMTGLGADVDATEKVALDETKSKALEWILTKLAEIGKRVGADRDPALQALFKQTVERLNNF